MLIDDDLLLHRFISATPRELGQYAAIHAGIIEGVLKACMPAVPYLVEAYHDDGKTYFVIKAKK